MANQVRVFISYSHRDDELRERLRAHLSQLERDGLVEAWDDREIPAGGEWADEIDERVEQADIILLLVSADFIKSDYCYRKEMGRALERHNNKDDRAIVIPLILHACDWQSAPFAKLQALPRDGRPLEDFTSEAVYFTEVAKGLRTRIRGMVEPGQGWLNRIGPRLRDPAWWQRPAVLAASIILVIVLALAAGLWWNASREVAQNISQATVLLRAGSYAEASAMLDPACRRWLVGRPACFVRDKAKLGAMLESEGSTLPVEQFAQHLETLKAQHRGEDPDLLLFSGALAMQARDPRQREASIMSAIKSFDRAIELDPRFAEAYYYLGSIHLMSARNQTDFMRARAELDKAIAIVTTAPHYLNARAYARSRLGDLSGAEADYRQSADAGSVMSRLDLAELLWLSGRFDAAGDQQGEALKQLKHGDMTGRNALPWVFELAAGRQLVLRGRNERICYARLAWQATQALSGRDIEPDRTDCGAYGSEIARAVAASLDRALVNGLPAEAVPRAQSFAQRLGR